MKMKKTAVSLVIAFTLIWFGCGGGSSGTTTAADTITLTSTIQAPVSTNIAAPTKGFGKAVTEAAASSVSCDCYTLEGELVGTGTTDSSGVVSISVDLDTLKGDEDSGSTWSEDVILVAHVTANNDVETYASVDVVEGTTTTFDLGTANIDTTLAAQALADKITGWNGWGSAYSVSEFDPECFFAAQKAMYEGSAIGGEGMADDIAIMKQTFMGFFAGNGDPTAYGFTDSADMLDSMMDGTIDDLGYWDDISGIADAYVDDEASGKDISDFGTAFSGYDAMDNFFMSSFASGGVGGTVLNIAGIGKAIGTNSTSGCADLKAGLLDPGAFVGPLLAADDAAAFATTYGDSDGAAVYFAMFEECMATAEGCAGMESKPGALWGYMTSFGGNYTDIYSTAGEFDATALEGSYLAAMACNGSTWEEMEDCAKGMYGTVYTGAGGDYTQFMSGGEFSSAEFDYYGGYYTDAVDAGTYDPDSASASNYTTTFENGQTYEGSMDTVQTCVDALQATGIYNYDPCYGNYNPAEEADQVVPKTESECNSMCESSCSMAPQPAECLTTCLAGGWC
ncbi:MAG: hypothetical protein A3I09_04930 [Deltaproteobacteria bacterium RIFCSPLOWO2_02_FULL_47_10]|nr:MAG: hypothetical protein A3I09_04930 [Deltaproteobacteria bacterium RIFCSPLOWO2_02_FULL_47_10]